MRERSRVEPASLYEGIWKVNVAMPCRASSLAKSCQDTSLSGLALASTRMRRFGPGALKRLPLITMPSAVWTETASAPVTGPLLKGVGTAAAPVGVGVGLSAPTLDGGCGGT